ncbi:MAG: DUF5684 domain-containing protein [Byssovorax sp.]
MFTALALVAKLVLFLFGGFWGLLTVISWWKTFKKAGEPGWAAIVPIYNFIVMLRIAGKPFWWLFLLPIPFIQIIPWVLMNLNIAKGFGRGPLFGLGLACLPIAPLFAMALAFGNVRYNARNLD